MAAHQKTSTEISNKIKMSVAFREIHAHKLTVSVKNTFRDILNDAQTSMHTIGVNYYANEMDYHTALVLVKSCVATAIRVRVCVDALPEVAVTARFMSVGIATEWLNLIDGLHEDITALDKFNLNDKVVNECSIACGKYKECFYASHGKDDPCL